MKSQQQQYQIDRKNVIVRLLKSSAFILLSRTIEAGVGFGTLAIIARHLGPELMGTYLLALSLSLLFQVIVRFGLQNITVREISKKPECAGDIFSYILTAQTVVTIIFMTAFLAVITVIWHKDILLAQCLILLVFSWVVLQPYRVLLSCAFLSVMKMHWDTVMVLIQQVFLLAGVVYWAFVIKGGPVSLCAFFLPSFSISVIIGFYLLHRDCFKIKIVFRFDKKIWWYFRESWVIAIDEILIQANLRLGVYLLGFLSNTSQIAFFSAPQRILLRIRMFMSALMRPLLPEFSQQAENNREKLFNYFKRSGQVFLGFGTALSIALFILSKPLVIFLLGKDFEPAASSFAIISLYIPFLFFSALCGYVILSLNRQSLLAINTLIGFLFQFCVAMVLIPRYHQIGAVGAAYAFLASCIGISILHYYTLNKLLNLRGFLYKQWPILVAASASVIVMKLTSVQPLFLLLITESLYVFILLISKYIRVDYTLSLLRMCIELIKRRNQKNS